MWLCSETVAVVVPECGKSYTRSTDSGDILVKKNLILFYGHLCYLHPIHPSGSLSDSLNPHRHRTTAPPLPTEAFAEVVRQQAMMVS